MRGGDYVAQLNNIRGDVPRWLCLAFYSVFPHMAYKRDRILLHSDMSGRIYVRGMYISEMTQQIMNLPSVLGYDLFDAQVCLSAIIIAQKVDAQRTKVTVHARDIEELVRGIAANPIYTEYLVDLLLGIHEAQVSFALAFICFFLLFAKCFSLASHFCKTGGT